MLPPFLQSSFPLQKRIIQVPFCLLSLSVYLLSPSHFLYPQTPFQTLITLYSVLLFRPHKLCEWVDGVKETMHKTAKDNMCLYCGHTSLSFSLTLSLALSPSLSLSLPILLIFCPPVPHYPFYWREGVEWVHDGRVSWNGANPDRNPEGDVPKG